MENPPKRAPYPMRATRHWVSNLLFFPSFWRFGLLGRGWRSRSVQLGKPLCRNVTDRPIMAKPPAVECFWKLNDARSGERYHLGIHGLVFECAIHLVLRAPLGQGDVCFRRLAGNAGFGAKALEFPHTCQGRGNDVRMDFYGGGGFLSKHSSQNPAIAVAKNLNFFEPGIFCLDLRNALLQVGQAVFGALVPVPSQPINMGARFTELVK